MKNEKKTSGLPQMDMNSNPIWDVLDGKVEPRKREKKKKLKKKNKTSIDNQIDFYFSELEKNDEEKHKKEKRSKLFVSTFSVIILLVLLAIIGFSTFIIWKYDKIEVKSDGMAQQIMPGNHILYQTDLSINRFNVVVLKNDVENQLLRVIGMPGDKVTLSEDVLTINGAIYDEEYLKENYVDFKLKDKNRNRYYTEKNEAKGLEEMDKEIVIVPENKFILLGDNRQSAKDSRTVGFYDKSEINGIAIMKIWPLFESEPIK